MFLPTFLTPILLLPLLFIAPECSSYSCLWTLFYPISNNLWCNVLICSGSFLHCSSWRASETWLNQAWWFWIHSTIQPPFTPSLICSMTALCCSVAELLNSPFKIRFGFKGKEWQRKIWMWGKWEQKITSWLRTKWTVTNEKNGKKEDKSWIHPFFKFKEWQLYLSVKSWNMSWETHSSLKFSSISWFLLSCSFLPLFPIHLPSNSDTQSGVIKSYKYLVWETLNNDTNYAFSSSVHLLFSISIYLWVSAQKIFPSSVAVIHSENHAVTSFLCAEEKQEIWVASKNSI